MSSASYDLGDPADLTVTVEIDDPDNPGEKILADPTTIVIKVRNPDGLVVTYEPVRESFGRYTLRVIPDVAGLWRWRTVTTGVGQAAEDRSFFVREAFSWLPRAEEVRSELSGRKAALDRLSDDDIDQEIANRAANLQGELPTDLAPRLQPVAHDYLLFSVASILEDRLFPEQARQPGSNAERLDRRAGAELVRLRGQLGQDVTDGAVAADWTGTLSLRGGR